METINNSNAKERAKLISIKKKLLEERKQCELCGSREKLCVHHILPLALGGTNDIDNLQVLCYNCHNYSDDIKAIHKKAKDVGNKRASEYKEVLISKTEFYYILYKKIEEQNGLVDVYDILDIIDSPLIERETCIKTINLLDQEYAVKYSEMIKNIKQF